MIQNMEGFLSPWEDQSLTFQAVAVGGDWLDWEPSYLNN
jgi:hypothetical protein